MRLIELYIGEKNVYKKIKIFFLKWTPYSMSILISMMKSKMGSSCFIIDCKEEPIYKTLVLRIFSYTIFL